MQSTFQSVEFEGERERDGVSFYLFFLFLCLPNGTLQFTQIKCSGWKLFPTAWIISPKMGWLQVWHDPLDAARLPPIEEVLEMLFIWALRLLRRASRSSPLLEAEVEPFAGADLAGGLSIGNELYGDCTWEVCERKLGDEEDAGCCCCCCWEEAVLLPYDATLL